tara:strand:+ start:79 stop:504 length:426 start_codon:yes stop_codon:yes gene_type:complete
MSKKYNLGSIVEIDLSKEEILYLNNNMTLTWNNGPLPFSVSPNKTKAPGSLIKKLLIGLDQTQSANSVKVKVDYEDLMFIRDSCNSEDKLRSKFVGLDIITKIAILISKEYAEPEELSEDFINQIEDILEEIDEGVDYFDN